MNHPGKAMCCYRCEHLVCICGAQGYIAAPLPQKYWPTSEPWISIDDHDYDQIKTVISIVIERWHDGQDAFDMIDALNAIPRTRLRTL